MNILMSPLSSEYSTDSDETDKDELIERQSKIITKLIKQNDLLKSKIIADFDNEEDMELVMKFIKIVYGLTEIGQNNCNLLIYGSLFEKFFSKKCLFDGQLNFLFENMEQHMICQIMERLDDIEYIINADYRIVQHAYINNNQEVSCINFWSLLIKMSNEFTLDIVFHDTDYTNTVLFDCQNLVLTKHGFQIRKFTENDIKNKNKHTSMSMLHIMNNLLNNKVEIAKNYNDFHNLNNKYTLFNVIEQQNKFLLSGFEIKKGYTNDLDDEAACGICYREHTEENACLYSLKCSHTFCSECLYRHTFNHDHANHLKCPLCRGEIKMNI